MPSFFRFPHTPHLTWLAAGQPRDDKVLTPPEQADFLSSEIIIEEKADGANLGISISPAGELRLQNRGHYLEAPYSGQFSRLGSWLTAKEDQLFDALAGGLILYGEWCQAVHSMDYDALPDFFLGFDVYDRQSGRFWSTRRRDALLTQLGLHPIHRVACETTTLPALVERLTQSASHYRAGHPEGFYLRRENPEWLEQRAKLVRPDFTQAIDEHWSRRGIVANRLK